MQYLGNKFIETANIEDAKEFYENLIKDVIICREERAGSDPDAYREKYSRVISCLEESDFFEAPASTRYHDNCPGGLLLHSLRVYNEMLEIIKLPKFNNVELDSAALCCLVHDWCKIGLYEGYKRNVKNEDTGKWEQVDAYKYVEHKSNPLGHGVTSMYIAGKFFDLTIEEALAIRWHMGGWQVCTQEMSDIKEANACYPLVHLLQFSDQLSVVEY